MLARAPGRLIAGAVSSPNTAAAEQCFNRARDAYERSRPIREAAMASEEFSTDALREQPS